MVQDMGSWADLAAYRRAPLASFTTEDRPVTLDGVTVDDGGWKKAGMQISALRSIPNAGNLKAGTLEVLRLGAFEVPPFGAGTQSDGGFGVGGPGAPLRGAPGLSLPSRLASHSHAPGGHTPPRSAPPSALAS